MRKGLAVALALVVVGVLLWLLLRTSGIPAGPQPAPRVTDQVAHGQPELAKPDALSAERAPASPAESPPPSNARDDLAEVRGRFLFPGGAPAKGVSVDLEGQPANDDLVLRYGTPKDWKNLQAASGEDGRFSIRLDPPRAFQFFLRARLDGWVKETWRWSSIAPGEVKDVGEITLKSGGTILGQLVDTSGRALGPGWSVNARGGGGGGIDREEVWERREADPATGEFTIEEMPPGPAKLSASSALSQQVDGPTVEVREGELVEARIVYSGADLSRRILVLASARPFFLAGREIEEMVLRGSGIEPRKAAKNPTGAGYLFDDIPPGRYAIEIRDSRFHPWSQDGVEPGSRVTARLEGSAAVRLTVVEEYASAPVTEYRVFARNSGQIPGPLVELLHAGETPPPDGLFEKIVPQDLDFLVRAEGFADCTVPAPGLQPGEVRPLLARLSRGAGISGSVVEAGTGKTMPRVAVQIRRFGERSIGERPKNMPWLEDLDAPWRDTETAADGAFAFAGIPEGRYLVRAVVSALVKSEVEDVTLAVDEQRDGLELTLPATSRLKGRLTGPKGARFAGLKLLVVPAVESPQEKFALMSLQTIDEMRPTIGTRVTEDGRFATGPILPGRARVGLRVPMAWLPGATFASPSEPIDLGGVELPPGEVVERDFDVSDMFPGFARVNVSVNGAPAPGMVVEARTVQAPAVDVGGGVADGSGEARVGPLPPGEYRFLVRPPDSSWTYLAPGSIAVRCCDEPAFAVAVTLVEGALRFVDAATDAPLAGAQLSGLLDGEVGPPSFMIKTDSAGVAQLRLPVGRYFACRQSPFNSPAELRSSFDWTSAGPVPAVVALRKPD